MTKRAAQAYDQSNTKIRAEVEDYHVKAGHPAIFKLPDSEKTKWSGMIQPVINTWVNGVKYAYTRAIDNRCQ